MFVFVRFNLCPINAFENKLDYYEENSMEWLNLEKKFYDSMDFIGRNLPLKRKRKKFYQILKS